jgi:hypothetical protein
LELVSSVHPDDVAEEEVSIMLGLVDTPHDSSETAAREKGPRELAGRLVLPPPTPPRTSRLLLLGLHPNLDIDDLKSTWPRILGILACLILSSLPHPRKKNMPRKVLNPKEECGVHNRML